MNFNQYTRNPLGNIYKISLMVGYVVVSAILVWIVNYFCFNWPHNDDFLFVSWFRHICVENDYRLLDILAIRDGNHLQAFQALVGIVMFLIFGINFKAIIFLNTALLITTSVSLYLFTSKFMRSKVALFIASIGMLLIVFHPVQTTHFFWPSCFGWFFVNLLFVVNGGILEKYGSRALPLIGVLCVSGMFSIAHGCVLWLGVATHLALKRDEAYVRNSALFLGIFLANCILINALTPHGVGKIHIVDMGAFLIYLIQLMGTLFCVRSTFLLLYIGIGTLAIIALLFKSCYRLTEMNAAERISVSLISSALVTFLFFGKGRFQYGLPWALDDMHFGTMWVPLLLGMVTMSLVQYEKVLSTDNLKCKIIAIIPCLYVFASIAIGVPYLVERGFEIQTSNALGMSFTCDENQSIYLVENLDLGGLKGSLGFINEQMPLMRGLCKKSLDLSILQMPRVRTMLDFPGLYTAMIFQNPNAEKPLRDLWDLYRVRLDLARAFPVLDSKTPQRLLMWARNSVLSGEGYDHDKLDTHKDFYAALPKE